MGASADDTSEYNPAGVQVVTWGPIYCYSDYTYLGLRFTSGSWPVQGDTIDAASLQVYPTHTVNDNPDLAWFCEDAAGPIQFTATPYELGNRTRTTASAVWVAADVGYNQFVTTSTVVAPIQEVVDSYTITALTMIAVANGGRLGINAWDSNTANAAKLDIDYSEAGFVEGAVSISGVGSMAAAASLTLPAAVAMSGVGTMVVAGTKGTTKTGAVALSGVGTMSGAGVITAGGEAAMSGVGSMAVVGERIVPGAVAMSGVGSMSAIGEVSGLLEGRADISGVGTMTVVAERIAGGSASFSGVGSMSVEAAVTLVGQASLSGVGSMAVIGETGVVLYTIFGGVLRSIDPADYPDGAQFFLEVTLEAGSGTARARLYNITAAAEVTNSPLSTSSLDPVRVRSSALTLASGANTYRVEYGGAPGGEYTIYAADLLVESD